MGTALWLINTLMDGANKLVALSMSHPFYLFLAILPFIVIKIKKDYSQAKAFIHLQHGYIILDGLFQKGKTRFLALLAREAREKDMFVICNYYNKYENIRWSSIEDLKRVLEDLWLLGECQNYTEADIKTMYKTEGKERVGNKINQMKKNKKKYKNIPYNGYHTKILLQGDEMQNIFYNRDAMSNFAGEKRGLLKLLHQVRHFNTLATFALTDVSEIDIKFRKIASYYLSFSDMLGGIFLKYQVYNFETDKENNFDLEKAVKITKIPVFKFNGYEMNKIIVRIERLIKRRIKYRFSELGFFSKYNADPDVDVYEKGQLFEYLEEYYKNNPGKKTLWSN